MKTIEIGKAKWRVQVDDNFVSPEGYSLSVSQSGYVKMLRSTGERRPSGSYVYEEDYLHRWLMKAAKDKVVLFIDCDRLNLQRDNLLVCERAVSIRHTGGRSGRFKGVHFSKKQLKWTPRSPATIRPSAWGPSTRRSTRRWPTTTRQSDSTASTPTSTGCRKIRGDRKFEQ